MDVNEVASKIKDIRKNNIVIEHKNIISERVLYTKDDYYVCETKSEEGISFITYARYDCMGITCKMCEKSTLEDCIDYINSFEYMNDIISESMKLLPDNDMLYEDYMSAGEVNVNDELTFNIIEGKNDNYEFYRKIYKTIVGGK